MAENPENNANTSGVTIGVVKESVPGETRVGLIPDSVKHLVGKGLNVVVQSGAGEGSSIADDEYEAAGARVVQGTADVHNVADVVVRVQSPAPDRGELEGLKQDQVLVSYLAPLVNHDLNRQLADSGVTAMAMDAVPRITRAQSMDSLSAMSTISGYKAVLMAAETLPKFFPLLMTAAGTIRPARVLVLGAGVAGLQAIATARRLGAVVEAYDVRAVVKEQVESLGAKFVEIDTGAGNAEVAGGYAREATPEELKKQQEGLNDHIANSDVVITTALVPGRPAPKMIPASAVERMRAGSVIVDLAAETGGNCELTTPGEVTKEHGVTIFGTLNLPATLPVHASQMYAKVITNFLDLLIKDGQVNLNFDDEIIASMAITNRGEIVQAQTRKLMGLEEAEPAAPSQPEPSVVDDTQVEAVSPDDTDGINTKADPDETPGNEVKLDDGGGEPTYRPFDSGRGSDEDDSVTTYRPFANETPLGDAVDPGSGPAGDMADPSTEIVSYVASDDDSGDEYITADEVLSDTPDTGTGTGVLSADDGSEDVRVDGAFPPDSESLGDGLAGDDGTRLEADGATSGTGAESATSSDSNNFSASLPEVHHVQRYDSGSSEPTIEADKLASFLNDEDFGGDADDESRSESMESDTPGEDPTASVGGESIVNAEEESNKNE